MRKLPVFLIAALLLLVAVIVLLSTQAREVPLRTIETEVGANGNAG